MTSICVPGVQLPDCYDMPDANRYQNVLGPGGNIMYSFPAPVLGTTTLTLTNLVVNSAIRIEVASTGALVTSRTAASASEEFSLDYYTSGSASNDLRIKVRKASSAPLYKPYETQATLGAASQSIFIAQQLD